MQDGTKIRALASSNSFQHERGLRRHLECVREYVRGMGEAEAEEETARVHAARQRARRERQERLQRAVAELDRLRAQGSEVRVSVTDPQARNMKQSDGGFAPSYNVQISADAAHGAIVSVDVVQDRNDRHQLLPALTRIQQQLGRKPQQMVADGDYTTCANIEAMQQHGVDFVGSWRDDREDRLNADHDFVYDQQQDCYLCPQGKQLRSNGSQIRSGVRYHYYRARERDCRDCPQRSACCTGNSPRSVLRAETSVAVEAFRQKMASPEAKAQYRRRSQVVEFCHAWIKSKLGLRQFHLRGMVKAKTEALWAALTYNLQLMLRSLKPQPHPLA